MTPHQQVIKHTCTVCRDISLSPRDFLKSIKHYKGSESFPLGQIKDIEIAAEKGCLLSSLVIQGLAQERIQLAPDTTCQLKWDGYYSSDNSGNREVATQCLYLSYGPLDTWGPRFIPLADDAPVDLSFGRLVDAGVDAGMLKKWLSLCDSWHGAECSEPIFIATDGPWSLPDFYLIDVDLNCLVKRTEPSRYLALSYIWGSVPSLLLTLLNLAELQTPGALAGNDILSNTISDAIKLTKLLGEHYLWVDQLCIIQDLLSSKQEAISNMDRIYAHAELTIVAAAGSGAHSGLPGVDGRQRAGQVVERVKKGLRMMHVSRWPEELDRSDYETRAWTFQERVLSRRCLFFLNDHVTFRCRNAIWREDVVCESPKLRYRDSTIIWQYGAVGTQLNQRLATEDHRAKQRHTEPLRDYAHAMNEYSTRRLTFQSDAIDACKAILKQIATTMGFDLFYCIPRQFLELGLLWYGGDERRTGFPSWSWIGWKGRTMLGFEIQRRLDIIFWLSTDCWISWLNMDGEHLHLATVEETGEYTPEEIFKKPPDIDIKHTIPWQATPTFVPKDYYLKFWTFSIRLKISHLVNPLSEYSGLDADVTKHSSVFDLRDRHGGFAGRLLSHGHKGSQTTNESRDPYVELLIICRQRWHSLDDFPPGQSHFYRFLGFDDGITYPHAELEAVQLTDFESGLVLDDAAAKVAMSSYPEKKDQRPQRLYDVLRIKWCENGVAERTGIGMVLASAAEGSFEPGVAWKEIVMG